MNSNVDSEGLSPDDPDSLSIQDRKLLESFNKEIAQFGYTGTEQAVRKLEKLAEKRHRMGPTAFRLRLARYLERCVTARTECDTSVGGEQDRIQELLAAIKYAERSRNLSHRSDVPEFIARKYNSPDSYMEGMRSELEWRWWRLREMKSALPLALFKLSLFLETLTGRARFEEMAKLLNTAFRAKGFDKEWKANSLMKRVRRFRGADVDEADYNFIFPAKDFRTESSVNFAGRSTETAPANKSYSKVPFELIVLNLKRWLPSTGDDPRNRR